MTNVTSRLLGDPVPDRPQTDDEIARHNERLRITRKISMPTLTGKGTVKVRRAGKGR
jgi:hypothetical protein